MKNLLILTLLVMFFAGCSLKGPETTGIITHEGGGDSKSESITTLQKMAASNPAAAYDMGLRYLRGDGVAQNSYKGLQSFRAAGEHGDVQAQAALGKLYLTGLEEMGSDPMEAAKWLRLAAGQGDRQSARLLKKVEAARQKDLDDYVDPALYRWYWHTPYRLYWYRRAWLVR